MAKQVTLWDLVSKPPYLKGIPSKPPSGGYRITNLYVNDKGKVVVEWSDAPQGG